jgi:hypothetical protein
MFQEDANALREQHTKMEIEVHRSNEELFKLKEKLAEKEKVLIADNIKIKNLYESREKDIQTLQKEVKNLEPYKGLSEVQEKEIKKLKIGYQALEDINIEKEKNLTNSYDHLKKYDTELTEKKSEQKKNQKIIKEQALTIQTIQKEIEELRKTTKTDKKLLIPFAKSTNSNNELLDAMIKAQNAGKKLDKRISRLTNKDEIDTLIDTLIEKEVEVLKTIYNKGMRKSSDSSYISTIASNNTKGFNQSQVRNILDDLITKKCISIDAILYYDTTSKGRKVMARLFDKN